MSFLPTNCPICEDTVIDGISDRSGCTYCAGTRTSFVCSNCSQPVRATVSEEGYPTPQAHECNASGHGSAKPWHGGGSSARDRDLRR